MIRDEIRALVLEEQIRQEGGFVTNVQVDTYVDKILRNAEIITYVKSGAICGMIAFYCNDLEKKITFVTLLLVAPHFRRQGVASILLKAAMDRACQLKFKKCRLEVSKKNINAIRFYEKEGYLVCSESQGSYVMARELS